VTVLMEIGLVLVGLGMLLQGGNKLVDGAQAIGLRYGLSPVFVGLTIVSMGTSAPELATTLTAAFKGAPAMALGNVIGSNLANIGLVLGIVGLLKAVQACKETVRSDYPMMLGALLLVWPLAQDGSLTRGDGGILLVVLMGYLFFVIRRERRKEPEELGSEDETMSGRQAIVWIVVGVGLLTLGSDWLVDGAAGLARRVGISERVIGLTLLALGTSLPELVSSLVAAFRGETELLVGNLVGSNIFNVLAILGLTTVIAPLSIPDWELAQNDIFAMVAVSLVGWFLLQGDARIKRWEGGVLLASYLAAITFLY
jgi:cation:H+ antiporter